MSKRSREDRRKTAETRKLRAGNAEAPAPPERPKEPLVQRQVGADPRLEAMRPIYLTKRELQDVIAAVEHRSTQHRLLPYLKQIKGQFDDLVLQMKELVATELANAFWMEDKGVVARILPAIRNGRKKGHRKLEEAAASPTVEEAAAAVPLVGKEGGE